MNVLIFKILPDMFQDIALGKQVQHGETWTNRCITLNGYIK